MKKSVKQTLANWVNVYESENKQRLLAESAALSESNKTDIQFNNEYLYIAGNGHDFAFGFYDRYLTKSGVEAVCYTQSDWRIGGKQYTYGNCVFTEVEQSAVNSSNLDNMLNAPFDITLKAPCKTIGNDLVPELPMSKPEVPEC
jgi:hypothetical protein